MKVQIFGRQNYTSFALIDRLALEEDEATFEPQRAILKATDFEGIALASMTVEALYGYEVQTMSPSPYCLMKVFTEIGFSNQLAVGVPLIGSQAEGLGFPMASACGVKFMSSPALEALFNDKLAKFLEEAGHRGVVTLEMSGGKVQQIHLGAPSLMLYAMLECWPGRLSEFAVDPLAKPFFPRWCVASLVSCFPYPAAFETKEKALVRGLIRPVRKHFWAFTENGIMKESFKTNLTAIGVVTSWDHTLSRVCTRAISTCQNIEVPMKQYRTDLFYSIRDKWEAVEPLLV